MPISRAPRRLSSRVVLRWVGDGSRRRHQRELVAFARYCVARIERDLGNRDSWLLTVASTSGRFTTTIVLRDRDDVTEVIATGLDGALTIWDAMCRIEQRLREASTDRARRRLDAP